jgi:hypothetical protein
MVQFSILKLNNELHISSFLYHKMNSNQKKILKDILKKYLNITFDKISINTIYSCDNVNKNFKI